MLTSVAKLAQHTVTPAERQTDRESPTDRHSDRQRNARPSPLNPVTAQSGCVSGSDVLGEIGGTLVFSALIRLALVYSAFDR